MIGLQELYPKVRELLRLDAVVQAQTSRVSATSAAAGGLNGSGLLAPTATAFASGTVDATGAWARFLSDGSGSDTDTARSTEASAALAAKPRAYLKYALTSGTANRIFVGLSSVVVPSTNDTPLHSVGVQKRAADTNWFFYSNDGSGPPTRVDSGIPVDATAYTVKVDAKTATSVTVSLIDPNGNVVSRTTLTTTLPGAGELLYTCWSIDETAAAVSQFKVYYAELTLRP